MMPVQGPLCRRNLVSTSREALAIRAADDARILLDVTCAIRSIAASTIVLFAIELAAIPCGPACHRSQTPRVATSEVTSEESAEHSCHEAPVQEDVAQLAGAPVTCTHQHDIADSPRTSPSSDRDQHIASIPVVALLLSHEGVVHPQAALFPQPRNSIFATGPSISLRI